MPDTNPDQEKRSRSREASAAMLLHVVCCGLPLLVLVLASAGVTVEGIRRALPYLWVIGGTVLLAAWIWIFIQWRRRRSLACRHCAVDAARPHGHDHAASTAPAPRGAGSSARSAFATPSSGGEDRARNC